MIVNFKIFNENSDYIEIPIIDVYFKVGDKVSPIKSSSIYNNQEHEIYSDQIYTIVDIYNNFDKNIKYIHSTNPLDCCDLIDKNNNITKTWYLKRFRLAEMEYQASKYNI
jgi:hypothetical protein